MTPKPHEQLASYMDARRTELGLSWREVADTAGITVETLRAIRRGSNEPSALTRRGIEKALKWAAGSVEGILAGGQPTLAKGVVRVSGLRLEVPEPPEDERSVMAELADAVERDPELARMILEIYRRGLRDGRGEDVDPPGEDARGTA